MPGDLGRAAGVFRAERDPDMVLGHGQVNVGKAEQLAGGHHAQSHAETVQLLLCNDKHASRNY